MDNGAEKYRRFLSGDEEAFKEIIDDYREGLIFFINRYVHDSAAAEDLSIDVFTELLVHRRRYNFKTSLKTYLYMIGRSKALNFIRHRKILPETGLSAAENLPSDELSPEEIVLRGETKRAVNDALEQLPEDMRVAVHLVYFEELSYSDASKVMRKSRKQVDNLLYRAKSALRTILKDEKEVQL